MTAVNRITLKEGVLKGMSEEVGFLGDVVLDGDDAAGSDGAKNKQIDIEVASSKQKMKLILELTWPSLAENILSSLASIVDMMMVGGLGAYAIAGIGLVTQPKFMMLAAFMAMNTGTTAIIARCKGAGHQKEANNAVWNALIVAFFLTIIVCTGMLAILEPLVRFIAGTELSEQAIQAGLIYLKIQVYGFPTMAFSMTINASLRGAGNTRAAFYNTMTLNLVNIFFNYCMIGGNLGFPRWEVAGASIATVIGQFVGMLMAWRVLIFGKEYITLDIKRPGRVEFKMIKRIINLGLPALIEQIIMRAGNIWFTTIVTALGDLSYAAHMIAMNVLSLSFTTGMSFGVSATTLVGQCLGRKRPDLAKDYVSTIQKLSFITSVAVAFFLFFGGKPVAAMYSKDLFIISLAASMLKIIAFVNPMSSARFVFLASLRGAGDTLFPAIVTFFGVLLARPLLSLLMVNVFNLGLTGVWIALSSDGVICLALAFMRYRQGKWQHIVI